MTPAVIIIGGKTYLLSDVIHALAAIPSINSAAKQGDTVIEIIKLLEPSVAAIIESLSNLLFPGLGTLESVVIWAIKSQRTMTQDEETAWMNRFGTVNV